MRFVSRIKFDFDMTGSSKPVKAKERWVGWHDRSGQRTTAGTELDLVDDSNNFGPNTTCMHDESFSIETPHGLGSRLTQTLKELGG